MKKPVQRIQLIINPAAGMKQPILQPLNTVFHKYQIEWDVSITHKDGDAVYLTQQAVAAGVDVVAAYGGDGTLMEVVNGLVGSEIPLAILPGGTGNAMAFELKIPRQLEEAAELICQEHTIRWLDVVQMGKRFFFLRSYTGLNLTYQATREMKEQFGLLAYAVATFQTITDPQRANFKLTIDGRTVETAGISCLIANASSVGGFDLSIGPTVKPDDGLLDVFVIDTDAISLLSIAGSLLAASDLSSYIQHWQGQEIVVEADPPQNVSTDGEAWTQTPVTATVVPQAIGVIVPVID